MTQSGASAALQGYRLQALYTLTRVLVQDMDKARIFQPEGMEDLDILDQNGNSKRSGVYDSLANSRQFPAFL